MRAAVALAFSVRRTPAAPGSEIVFVEAAGPFALDAYPQFTHNGDVDSGRREPPCKDESADGIGVSTGRFR
jgi:hypothetical protein